MDSNARYSIINSTTFLIFLIILTFSNIVFFFYIKNSTHYLKNKVDILSSEVINEQHNLSIYHAEFNKKYNVKNLQELAKNKLNLQFSNVNQITTLDEIIEH